MVDAQPILLNGLMTGLGAIFPILNAATDGLSFVGQRLYRRSDFPAILVPCRQTEVAATKTLIQWSTPVSAEPAAASELELVSASPRRNFALALIAWVRSPA